MEQTKNEISSKANGLAQDFKNKIQNTEKSLEKISHDVGHKVGEFASNVATSTTDYVASGRDYVQENPAKGVAIAAAAGVVAGSLLTILLRRRS